MKIVISLVMIALTISLMMSVALIPAFATKTENTKVYSTIDRRIILPVAKEKFERTKPHDNIVPNATTINQANSTTYIIIAIGIFIVAFGLGILIGYNIKKKKLKKES